MVEYEVVSVRRLNPHSDMAAVEIKTEAGTGEVYVSLNVEDIKTALAERVERELRVLRNLKALQEMAKSAEDTE